MTTTVTICGLERQYRHLNEVYLALAHREQTVLEDIDGTAAATGPCTKICGVDFEQELTPLPDDIPVCTDSDTNKFAMLCWCMLSACESGSVGGDACRMEEVLFAAADDAREQTAPGRQFEHLLGLTLAISNHGVESWIMRGDPHNGAVLFKTLGELWERQLGASNEGRRRTKTSAGISPELRKFAIRACSGLQSYLKSWRSMVKVAALEKKYFFGSSVKGWRGLLDLVYFEVFGRIDVNLGFAGFRTTSDLHCVG